MAHRTTVEKYLQEDLKVRSYTRIPDISERDKWDSIDPALGAELIKAGERALTEPWPQLLISDFTEFSKSGNRLKFEDKYMPRRRKLNALIMAECVENRGRFVDEILNGFYLILEESSWCLPAHNSYIRDTPQEYLPDMSRPIIDLFDAETGALMAMGEYVLRPVLKKISPYISDYVNKRLEERIFEPYFYCHFWWMGNGKEPMCNWTVWCTQNVLICALTREDELGEKYALSEILRKAALSCDYFLDDYGDDGCCNEGAQYYSHAGLCLFGCLELMEGALSEGGASENEGGRKVCSGECASDSEGGQKGCTGESSSEPEGGRKPCADASDCSATGRSKFAGVYSESLVRNVAEYIVRMHVTGDTYINFADCSRICGKRTAREYLFGKAVGSRPLMALAAQDFKRSSLNEIILPDEINLFYHMLQIFSYEEIISFGSGAGAKSDSGFTAVSVDSGDAVGTGASAVEGGSAAGTGVSASDAAGDFYFESTGLMVARDDLFTLAAKAGCNADSHNHNDVGSFTIYKGGKPMVIDLGVGTYTRETFSDKRYEIWTMQSQFHNLPTFVDEQGSSAFLQGLGADAKADFYNENIVMQRDGASFCARGVRCTPGSAVSFLEMDIAPAYGDERIRSYRRRVSLVKGSHIEVEDKYDGDLLPVLSVLTSEKPEVINGTNNTGAAENGNTEDMRIRIGDLGMLTVSGASDALVQAYPITDERLALAWKHEIYRILLKMGAGHRALMRL